MSTQLDANANDTDKSENKLVGANVLLNYYQSFDNQILKSCVINFDSPSILVEVKSNCPLISTCDDATIFNYANLTNYETQCFDNLYEHLRYLQLEFIGKSELVFFHTLLIILIRRGYQVAETFAIFERLWQDEANYLLQNLSLRWLVSASDTFIDYSNDPLRQAILMNVISLINTLKIYETQLYLSANNDGLINSKVNVLYNKHAPLYDGLSFIRLGSDDTLEQMHRRLLVFQQMDELASRILLTIFYRIHKLPTAFNLIKQLHTEDWGYRWLKE